VSGLFRRRQRRRARACGCTIDLLRPLVAAAAGPNEHGRERARQTCAKLRVFAFPRVAVCTTTFQLALTGSAVIA